jgi:hypothetical protein
MKCVEQAPGGGGEQAPGGGGARPREGSGSSPATRPGRPAGRETRQPCRTHRGSQFSTVERLWIWLWPRGTFSRLEVRGGDTRGGDSISPHPARSIPPFHPPHPPPPYPPSNPPLAARPTGSGLSPTQSPTNPPLNHPARARRPPLGSAIPTFKLTTACSGVTGDRTAEMARSVLACSVLLLALLIGSAVADEVRARSDQLLDGF